MPDSAPHPPSVQIPPFDPKALVDTAVALLTRPPEFFRSIKHEQGFGRCLGFSIPAGILAGLLAAAFFLAHGLGFGAAAGALLQYAISGLVGPFIGGLLLWVICMVFGSKATYEPSIRIVAYTYAIAPLTWASMLVPWIGWIAGLAIAIYGIYLVVVGAKTLNFEPAATAPPAAPPPPAS